jgi:hypothetical protein
LSYLTGPEDGGLSLGRARLPRASDSACHCNPLGAINELLSNSTEFSRATPCAARERRRLYLGRSSSGEFRFKQARLSRFPYGMHEGLCRLAEP